MDGRGEGEKRALKCRRIEEMDGFEASIGIWRKLN
jgi:hypothetical protein